MDLIKKVKPFNLSEVKRLNYHCDLSNQTNLFVYNEIENFAVAVWVDSLNKTGSFPPEEPYPAWLKTFGTKLSETCNDNPSESRYFRSGVQLLDSGTSLIQPGWVGYSYTWPMLCWVGDVYDY